MIFTVVVPKYCMCIIEGAILAKHEKLYWKQQGANSSQSGAATYPNLQD